MDYSEVGGAPLLGVQGAVVKAHGSSNGHAMACAIRQASLMAKGNVVDLIDRQIQVCIPQD
jgi:glycerol-3-phosphate acyltransferase PlsX